MRWLVFLAIGCGGGSGSMTPGWKPSVLTMAPPDPKAQIVTIPFSDGQNGTELVTKALKQARDAGATGLSEIAIQIDTCIREVGLVDHAPLLAPVIYETVESDLACTRNVDQILVDGSDVDANGKPQRFRDTQMVEHEDCKPTLRGRFVTREQVDFDHHFSPPRWREIAQWSGLALRTGRIHCDAHESRTELRMHVHFGEVPPAPPHALAPPTDPAPIFAAVAQARTTHDSTAALHAIELWQAADFEGGQPVELAAAIAEAGYLAVDNDAARFLAADIPIDSHERDLDWMQRNTAAVHAFGERYRWIADAVRTPAAKPWVLAGAERIEAMHLHLADMYDKLERAEAAKQERAAAQALASAASGAPVKR